MNNMKPLLYILTTVIVVFLLLLAECYIMAIAFGLISLIVALIVCYDDTPHKNQQQKQPRGNKNNTFSSNRWNGFSDPNDFPTDGYGNNGW